MARSFAERNRFGRVGRLPTQWMPPTPSGVGPEVFEALRIGLEELGTSIEERDGVEIAPVAG